MRPRQPLRSDEQQRYWRRRANRRVRKVRRARSALRWSLVLLVHASIAGVLLYAGYRGVESVLRSDEFRLARIEVHGAQHASVDKLEQSLAPQLGRNVFEIDLAEIENAARKDPWVERVRIKRLLPGGLRVTVIERRAAAVALIEGLAHLVDTRGYVIGVCERGRADDLPVLTGLDGLPDERLAAALARGVGFVERLRREAPDFAALLSELDLSAAGRVVAGTVDGGPRLLLDPLRIERNVREYVALRAAIARRAAGGVDYVDLRWRDRITFKPNQNDSGKGG